MKPQDLGDDPARNAPGSMLNRGSCSFPESLRGPNAAPHEGPLKPQGITKNDSRAA